MSGVEVPPVLRDIFQYIEENKGKFISNLKEMVEIPSVSSMPSFRQFAIYAVHWMAEKMGDYGIKTEICELGLQELPDGTSIRYPPLILGALGNDKNKKTVLIHCHLDVPSAFIEDSWKTDPFSLVEVHGKLYGRGVSDNKGPTLGWIHAIEAYQKCKVELPVNIKFLFFGMEDSNNRNEEFLKTKESFLLGTDFICCCDCQWASVDRPCLAYGFRGHFYFHVEVQCSKKDLHSGTCGGSVHEAMNDLIYLLNRLVDSEGNILIPGLYEDIEPVSPIEERMYANIDFNVKDYKDRMGCPILRFENKTAILVAKWNHPSLSIHGIEGGFHSDTSWQLIIPKKVTGKFSIRIVNHQDPKKIEKCVTDYLDTLWSRRKSPNKYRLIPGGHSKPWSSSVNHENYKAAWKATKYVYNVDPDLIRVGSSTPIISFLQELTKKSIIMLPMGKSDDNPHCNNEKLDVKNYINGTKVFAAYLYELGQKL